MTSEHRPPAWVTGHQPGVGKGTSRSVIIPKQYGRIAEWINKHIRSYHGDFGNGWPLYDHIVDDDWAKTGLAEGTIINTYTGTRIWSTWQGAISAAVDNDTIGVCPGAYVEDVATVTNITVHVVALTGPAVASSATNDWPVSLTGATGGATPALTITGGSGRCSFTGILFTGKTSQTAPIIDCANAGQLGRVQNCGFQPVAGQTAIDLVNALGMTDQIFDCYFYLTTSAIGITTGAGTTDSAVVRGCHFTGAGTGILVGEDVLITGNWFAQCALCVSVADVANSIRIIGNYAIACTTFCSSAGGAIDINVTDNEVNLLTTFIDWSSMTGTGCRNFVISGNHGRLNSSSTPIVLNNAAGNGGAYCIKNVMCHDNHFWANTGTVTAFRSGGNHPTNHYWNNTIQPAAGGNWGSTQMVEGGIGPGPTADIVYFTDDAPLTVAWTAFSIDWSGTVVAYAANSAGTVLVNTGTSDIYASQDGTVTISTTGWPATPHKKIVEIVTVGTWYVSHTSYGNLLYGQATAGGSLVAPNDAQYLVLAADSDLTVERVFAPGAGLTATDDGAGGDYHLIHATDATAIPSAHHTKYTNAEAIAAVEAEATLVLAGDVSVDAAKSLAVDHITEKTGSHGVVIDAAYLVVGIANTTAGSVAITGDHTGSPAGGKFTLVPAVDFFDPLYAWEIRAYEDDLEFSILAGATALRAKYDCHVEIPVGPLEVNAINEYTAATGVTVDGVLVKDGEVDGIDVSAHDTADTGVHGAGASTLATAATVAAAITAFFTETGTQALTLGAIADGEYLKRDGATVTSGTPAGGGAMATDPLWDALGDTAYGTGADTGGKVAGNTTTTKKFYTQTGDGAASAAPAWNTVVNGDLPGANVHMITGSFYAVPESTSVPKLRRGPMPFAGTFVRLTISSYAVAAESAIRVDMHKRTAANEDSNTSTTVFTTQTNRPTIAATHYAGHTDTFEVSTFAKGDWLDFFLDVDDSGIPVIDFGLEVTPL